MKAKLLAWIFPAALLFAVGCSEDTGGPKVPEYPPVLFYLNPGDYWVYDAEAYINDSLLYRNTDTVRVDTTATIWGGSIWRNYVGDSTAAFWRNGVDGIWRLRTDYREPYGWAEKYFAYPAHAGDNWSIESDSDEVTVVSISELVDVPAGQFTGCYYYRIESLDDSGLTSVWTAPGIGIVQESRLVVSDSDTLKTSRRLKEHQ